MADEYKVEVSGLSKEQAFEVYAAVGKMGPYAVKVLKNGEFVMGGAPNKPTAGTAPTFGKTKKS